VLPEEGSLPTGANDERKVLSTAVLTKSCAKSNPDCSLAAWKSDSRVDRSLASLAWRITDRCLYAKGCSPYHSVFTHVVFVVTK
jgi:hypothetical protein